MVFAKKKSQKLLTRLNFHWERQPLEIVPCYKYLGVTFSANGSFTTHTLDTRVKVAAAASKVWSICKKSGVPPIETNLKLFNSLVKSTLLYAAPLWGWGQEKSVEKAQTSFIRKLFRLPPTTPEYFCRLETKTTQIRLQIFKNTLDYWIKTIKRTDSLPHACLRQQLKWYQSTSDPPSNKHCWASKVVDTFKKLVNLDSKMLLSYPELKKIRNVLIGKYANLLRREDEERCDKSNFIPLYKYLRPNDSRPAYLIQNLSLPIVQLHAQLRFNRFSVKIGPHYIKLETRCPLCTSHTPNSVQHYMFECRPLINERQTLLKKYITDETCTSEEKLINILTIIPDDHTKYFTNLFLFWNNVAKYFDLCTDFL